MRLVVYDAGEASGALERKRRIRELEGLEPDLAAVFEHVSDQVVEANAAVEEARAAEGDAAGEIARLGGERRSLLSEIGRLEQSANNAEVERVRISKRREQAAEAVRAAVVAAIDAQVGVEVECVDVCIDGLVFPKE